MSHVSVTDFWSLMHFWGWLENTTSENILLAYLIEKFRMTFWNNLQLCFYELSYFMALHMCNCALVVKLTKKLQKNLKSKISLKKTIEQWSINMSLEAKNFIERFKSYFIWELLSFLWGKRQMKRATKQMNIISSHPDCLRLPTFYPKNWREMGEKTCYFQRPLLYYYCLKCMASCGSKAGRLL